MSSPPPRRASLVTIAQTFASRFAVLGLNAATGILTARLLAPEGRGELAAMSIWPILVAGLTTLGLPSALVYHGRRDSTQLGALTASALLLAAAAGAIGTAIAWAVIPIWLRQHPPEVIQMARYMVALGTVPYAVIVTGRAAWEARGNFQSSNVTQVAPPALTMVGLIVLAAAGRLTATTAAVVYVGVGVPVVIWTLATLLRRDRIIGSVRGEWRKLLHYGARSYGVDLFVVLAFYLDQALVVGLLPPAAMGIYAVALSLSRIINAVHGATATLILPAVVGYSNDLLTATIARAARMAAIAATVMGVVIVVAGPMLVGLLYGRAYLPVGGLMPVLVLQVIVGGLVQVLLQGLLAAGRPGLATMTQFIGLAVSVPIFLVLVPASGALGAAIALLVSTTIRLGLTMACYPLWLQAPLPRIWIDRTDVPDLRTRMASLLRLGPGAWLRGAAE